MKLKLIIILALIYLAKSACTNMVCCDELCSSCSLCLNGNSTTNEMCCENNILAAARSCSFYPPPCVTNNTSTGSGTVLEQFLAFVTDIPNIVFLSLCLIILIAMCYACTCFGNKKPPIPYQDIIWVEGMSWIKDE